MDAEPCSKIVETRYEPTTWQQVACILALLIVWSVWWGGLTFYAVVVVPIGTEVLGSVEQGFMTRQVTQWHNALSGLFTVALFVEAYRRRSRVLTVVSASLALILLALCLWHVRLTSMMDFKQQGVPSHFYAEHAVYLWMTAAEWALGIAMPFWICSPVLTSRHIQLELR